jgi:hypothetical protein
MGEQKLFERASRHIINKPLNALKNLATVTRKSLEREGV